jgi:8-oxo-dGTP pyrophosphatase MutT (NUDIX family)
MLDPDFARAALAAHPVRTLSGVGLRPAAVLVPLFEKGGEDFLLFTRRTELMNHHRGEISFPGGGRDAEDADLLQTALRETEEEMGICPADVTVLGRLDDFISVHGYRVSPFVGMFPYPYPCRVNETEIAEVIEAPLAVLRDPAIWRKENWRHRGRLHPVHFYTVGTNEIWGLTAAILRQFLKRIGHGRP